MYSLNFSNEKCVKMHDMVRDVALWIAREKHGIIMVNCAKDLNGLLEDEAVKDYYAVSSWNKNELLQFPSQLDAPKLKLLLLNSCEPLDLSRASFEGVKGLKVVALINESGYFQQSLLQPIQWLSQVRTLRLQSWDLGDISSVMSLKRLEILDLKGSKFKKVPNEIEKLNRLKLLDLSRCTVEECFCKLIGRCSQLEELYSSRNLQPSGHKICYECFVGVPALPKLRRYTLEIGQCRRLLLRNKGLRELSFGESNISNSSAIIKDLAQRAVAIEFHKLQGGCKTFSPDVVQAIGGINELTKLCLQYCSEIECFTDQTIPHEDIVVFRLVELTLKCMDNLKQLCCGPPNLSLFLNLESLDIKNCPQLVNVFPANCNLGNLKLLDIVNCRTLTSLFPISVACTLSSLESLDIKSCPQLVNVFPTNCNLGKLKFLDIVNCRMLTSLFTMSIACTLLSLEQLTIKRCPELKHIIEGEDGVDTGLDPRFPKWKILHVSDCNQLESICPCFCLQGFVRLKYLFIGDAPQLKFVFGEHVGAEKSICDGNDLKIVLPLLEELRLEKLPNLLRICPENYQLSCPSIMEVKWRNCPRLNASCDPLIRDSELRQPHPNMVSRLERFKTVSKGARSKYLRQAEAQVPERDQVYEPSKEELRSYIDPYHDVICSECYEGGDDDLMLLCDLCDSAAHTYCVGLGLEVPEVNWCCDGCTSLALGSSCS